MPLRRRAIVWFRQDLRLHDNEALSDALSSAIEVIPVFVFDKRLFLGKSPFGFPKVGKYRAKFILESVIALQRSLKQLNSELIIRFGKTEDEIFKIAQKVKSSWVFCNRERTYEEVIVQDALEKRLWSIGQEIRFSRGKMLYHTGDLPFPVQHTPDTFTQFRKEVERYVQVREPIPRPAKSFNPLTVEVDAGEMPTIEDFGFDAFEVDARAAYQFKGGEVEALKRLNYYLWETNLAKDYKKTRNQLIGGDYSTKFSPWLAQGCLSPKQIYHELKRFEAERGANKSTYWIFFELLWRDFFRFMAKKHGSRIFLKGGLLQKQLTGLSNDKKILKKWINGRTGVPFIDANMLELKHTGYMSNRGRQNVASFLVKDLQLNWQMGAEYFESTLIDYDVASNWGNWNYLAGVGNDPKENRYFNILAQAQRYDPQGIYVKHWLPSLRALPGAKVHAPDQLSSIEQEQFNFHIGIDYPKPLIDPETWMSH